MKKNLLLVCGMAMTIGSVMMSCTNEDPVTDPPKKQATIELSSADSQVTISTDKSKATGIIDFAGGSFGITVTSSPEEWEHTVTDENARFTVVKADNTLTISAPENTSLDDTYAMTITVTTGEEGNQATATISVTQGSTAPAIYYTTEDSNVTVDRENNVLTIELENGAAAIEKTTITSNFGDWAFNEDINDIEWLTFEKDLAWMILNAPQNMNYEDRSGTFTLTIGEDARKQTITVNVTQKRLPAALTIALATDNTGNITVAGDSKSASNSDLSSAGDTFKIAVTSTGAWSYTLSEESAEINSVSVSGTVLTYTITPNGAKDVRRNLTLTIHAGVDENYSEAIITINQRSFMDDNASLVPMVLEVTTTEPNQQVYLPLYGGINCYIDWGDTTPEESFMGSNPTVTAGTAANHTYANAGRYEVTVTGIVTALDCVGSHVTTGFDKFNTDITGVKDWGNTGLTSMWRAFQNCTALASLPASDEHGAFAEVTSFAASFSGCRALTSIPAEMFKKAISPDLKTFANVFFDCSGITVIPADLFVNNTEVTNFSNAFNGCNQIVSIPGTLFASNTKVTDFSSVFQNCSALATLPGTLFAGKGAVTTFASAFQSCVALTEVPVGLFDSNEKVSNVSRIFQGCAELEIIPTSIFDKAKSILNFSNAFNGCSKWTGESPYYTGTEPKIHIYERATTDGVTLTAPQSFNRGGCFTGCNGLTDYSSIPSGWGGGGN